LRLKTGEMPEFILIMTIPEFMWGKNKTV